MSGLAGLIAGYLVAMGWIEDEPGRWRPRGVKRNSRLAKYVRIGSRSHE